MNLVINTTETTPNQHIEDYLDFYLKNEPEFAVMVKGDWGTGKTFFIKQYIDERPKAILDKGNYIELNPIYISLNGINEVSQINKKIKEILSPILHSKGAQFFKQIGASFVKNACKIDLKDIDIEIEIDILTLFKNSNDNIKGDTVLVFDDLERCKLPIEESLGYINDLVENNKVHVIVIADETKITNQNTYPENIVATTPEPKSPYDTIKEKTFGHTLQFNSVYTKFLKHTLENLNDVNCNQFASKNIGLINDLVEISKCTNLRIIKRALTIFNDLYSKIDLSNPINPNTEEIKIYILKILIIYYIEINFYNRDKNYLLAIKQIEFIESFLEEEESKSRNLLEKYNDITNLYGSTFFEQLNILLFNYIVNYDFKDLIDLINTELNSTRKVSTLIVHLKSKESLEDSEFSNCLIEIDKELKNNELSFNDLSTLISYKLSFEKEGLFPQETTKTIIEQYIESTKKINLTEFYTDNHIFIARIKHILNTNDYKGLIENTQKQLLNILEEKKENATKERAEFLANCLESNFDSFIDLFYTTDTEINKEYKELPLFESINTVKFIETIKKLNNKNILELSQACYSLKHFENKKEQENLKYIIEELKKYTTTLDPKENFIKLNNYNELIKALELIISPDSE